MTLRTLLALSLVAAGCGGGDGPPTADDAGVADGDGGGMDAGADDDAGPADEDAGGGGDDAGGGGDDAGPGVDAGDAVDAGRPITCFSSAECDPMDSVTCTSGTELTTIDFRCNGGMCMSTTTVEDCAMTMGGTECSRDGSAVLTHTGSCSAGACTRTTASAPCAAPSCGGPTGPYTAETCVASSGGGAMCVGTTMSCGLGTRRCAGAVLTTTTPTCDASSGCGSLTGISPCTAAASTCTPTDPPRHVTFTPACANPGACSPTGTPTTRVCTANPPACVMNAYTTFRATCDAAAGCGNTVASRTDCTAMGGAACLTPTVLGTRTCTCSVTDATGCSCTTARRDCTVPTCIGSASIRCAGCAGNACNGCMGVICLGGCDPTTGMCRGPSPGP